MTVAVPNDKALLPTGFRRDANGAGLIVPEAHSRRRIVLTKDETKALDRCLLKVLGRYELRWALFCDHEGCPEPRIEHVREPGHFVLRCGHADRVMETSF